MSLQAVREQALKYLKIDPQSLDAGTAELLDSCLTEIQTKATPHYITKIYPLTHSPLGMEDISLDYPELSALFGRCHSVCVIGATLGMGVDRHSKLLSRIDMAKLVVFDAVASSYLEVLCDQYEERLNLGQRTFRYCPGYGSVPLDLNRILCRSLQMDRHIGLTVQPSLLLLPQKSMIGLIGIGDWNEKKSCYGCHKLQECDYRKKEQRCYIQSQNN